MDTEQGGHADAVPGGSEPETQSPLTHSEVSEWIKPDCRVRRQRGAQQPGDNLYLRGGVTMRQLD